MGEGQPWSAAFPPLLENPKPWEPSRPCLQEGIHPSTLSHEESGAKDD